MMKLFDLNIQEVLEHWEVEHAIREIIANALDEQVLTNSEEIKIQETNKNAWVIQDYGRGLQIDHFTLNENQEKIENSERVIGKFGVGLKDALATFHRKNIEVSIKSSFGIFRLVDVEKHGFEDIQTLHVAYDNSDQNFNGTEVTLKGVTHKDINKAKSLFLRFSDERTLEDTDYGSVFARDPNKPARVYIKGVLASEEDNFLFSYNITDLTDSMRKRLNRERLNVGRTVYTPRIKYILQQCSSSSVVDLLTDAAIRTDTEWDEIQWLDVAQKALTDAHQKGNYVYLTQEELEDNPDLVQQARKDGYDVKVIRDKWLDRLEQQKSEGGPSVRFFSDYVTEYNESFEYDFVEEQDLTPNEKAVLSKTKSLIESVGVNFKKIPNIKISEKFRANSLDDTKGTWNSKQNSIIIHRKVLTDLNKFAEILLHELAHWFSGADDCTRAFESQLTDFLGNAATIAIRKN